MKTFHVSTPIRHSFACGGSSELDRAFDGWANAIITMHKRDPEAAMLAVGATAQALIANKSTRPPAGRAPRAAAALPRGGAAPAKGAGNGFRTSASKDSGTRSYSSARDRERAAAMMPESALLGVLARTNPVAAVAVASAMVDRRALAVKAANYKPALPGTPQYMSDRDRQRAAEFAHLPSSLDVWRAQQSRKAGEMSPEDELVHDNPGMAGDARARDFLDHQAEMKAIAQGRKPAARSAPRSDRGGYRG